MSDKNKSKDRDSSGKIKRRFTGKNAHQFLRGTPKSWIQIYMNRPKRRENKAICKKITDGKDPDEFVFPLGSRKPHHYYW